MSKSKVYVIADLHFGHKGILNFRPEFKSIEHHDTTIMNNILQVCGKRSTLWLLGDCFFTEESLDYLRTLRASVGTIHWVLGNHDTQSAACQRNLLTALSEGLVDKVHGLVRYKDCWFTHAPIHDSELRGKYCVYGHTHSVRVYDPRYFGVSCEQINYTPIAYDTIINTLKNV